MEDMDYGSIMVAGEEFELNKHTSHFGHKHQGNHGDHEDDHEIPYKKLKLVLTGTMGVENLEDNKVLTFTLTEGGGLTLAEWDEGDLREALMQAVRNNQDLIGDVSLTASSDFPYPFIVAFPSLPIKAGRRMYGRNYVAVMVNTVPGVLSSEVGTTRSLKHEGAQFLLENPGVTPDNLTVLDDYIKKKNIVLVGERSPIILTNNAYYDEKSQLDVLEGENDPLMLNGKLVERFEADMAINGSFQMHAPHYEYFEATIRQTMSDSVPLGNATGPEFKAEVFAPSGANLNAIAIEKDRRFTATVFVDIEYLRVGKDVDYSSDDE